MDRRNFLKSISGLGVAAGALGMLYSQRLDNVGSSPRYASNSHTRVPIVDPFEFGENGVYPGVTYLDYHIWEWTGWKGWSSRDPLPKDDRLAGQWLAQRVDWKTNREHRWNHIYVNCPGIGSGEYNGDGKVKFDISTRLFAMPVTTSTSQKNRDEAQDEGFERMLKMIEDFSSQKYDPKNVWVNPGAIFGFSGFNRGITVK